MASNLAPVYLDDARVTLQGDPRPQVAKILQAGGHAAGEDVQVVRLREAAGADGHPIGLQDVIDREKAITPVYLRVLKDGRRDADPSSRAASKGNLSRAPGDIARGTETVSPRAATPEAGEVSARKGAPHRFAETQSFGDAAHKGGSPRVAPGSRPSKEVPAGHLAGGGIRTQETASEEGAGASEEE
jgi:hypothetical protein